MRRQEALGLVLLVAAALAGCIGNESESIEPQNTSVNVSDGAQDTSENAPAEAQETPEEASEPEPLVLASPEELPHDTRASEPTIEAAPDGTLYLTAPAYLPEKPNVAEGAAWLWQSTDGGDSWQILREPDLEAADTGLSPTCSCDSDVATSPDGWIYYTDWWLTGVPPVVGGNFLVEASDDGGQTWNEAPVTTPHATNVDRQWLVTGEDGFVGLFYHHSPLRVYPPTEGPTVPEPAGVKAVFSTDHGRTWSPPATITEEGSQVFHQISKPVNVGEGNLAIAYGSMNIGDSEEYWTAPGEVQVAVSTDRGESWEQRTVADVPGGFDNLWAVQAAGDDAGNLHVAWAARTDETMPVYHASTPDLGETVDGPTTLRSTGLNFLPWIAAHGDGEVAVGWYGGNATGDPREADENATWHAYVAERAGMTGEFATTRVNDEPVKIGPMCPRGAACEDNRELLDYVGLTYTPDGRLHYAFAQSDTADEDQPAAAIVHYAAEISR